MTKDTDQYTIFKNMDVSSLGPQEQAIFKRLQKHIADLREKSADPRSIECVIAAPGSITHLDDVEIRAIWYSSKI